jgi:hypothetical protein
MESEETNKNLKSLEGKKRLLMMANGEKVIARILEITNNGLVIEDPAIVRVENNQIYFNLLFDCLSEQSVYFMPTARIRMMAIPLNMVENFHHSYVIKMKSELESFKRGDDFETVPTDQQRETITYH